ncbi:response regulator [Phragmitibacter flavus]|uniref:histidine kinase n=1 Tax=Phragmitibacter flavus TaxID=2576071 RepID=A0A5R8K7K9_9BACT|nr:hybrid sensor histidine kinase/response regulator [Phragmitibacter flavus]TLD68338.1 response regulator [Phragmitibacter flavus]
MEPIPGPRHILILDDNDIDRETCQRYLSRSSTHEYRFVEHNAVEGALDVVRAEKPDCILLDYHLHDGNGLEFLNELVSIGGPRIFPVVMLTGTGNEAIAVEVMKLGAQDYLMKDGLNPEVLQRSVEAAIYKAQAERLLDQQRLEMERLFHQAHEANARKDHFLAALSHELRTPLTPVLAAVSSIDLETADETDLREMVAVVRRNIELEARLIDDLLDLTRISKGKLEVDLHPADLHSILTHAVETCREDIQQKQLTLDWQLNAATPIVQVDAARLQQVFWNLLKNAVKFTPVGGHITLNTRDTESHQIEVRVSDSGIGIEPAHLDKIFNAFEQGNSEITRRFGGLGLGLAISKALIEAHHGTVCAQSSPETPGATFIVTLKKGPTVSLPTHNPASAITPKTQFSSTILLVEDHADSAFFLAKIMEKSGCRVLIAPNVAEALAIFEKESIDCVVSDIGLPDGSGTDLMKKLAQIRPVPAIALSGYGMEEDIQRSRSAGFKHHLTKPVQWDKLKKILAEVLAETK